MWFFKYIVSNCVPFFKYFVPNLTLILKNFVSNLKALPSWKFQGIAGQARNDRHII